MSDWLTDPKPCSETLTVKHGKHFRLLLAADDGATAFVGDTDTPALSELWVIQVLGGYDLIQELRAADDGQHKNAVIRFFPATGG